MTEREKVIKTLNDALTAKENYPWAKAEMSFDFIRILIDLLKKQEAVAARKKNDGKPQPWTCWWYVCGDCGQEIEYHDRFCRWCGRVVKWNDV